jgi:hypothetical protein
VRFGRVIGDSEKAAMQGVFEHHSREVPSTSTGTETAGSENSGPGILQDSNGGKREN